MLQIARLLMPPIPTIGVSQCVPFSRRCVGTDVAVLSTLSSNLCATHGEKNRQQSAIFGR